MKKLLVFAMLLFFILGSNFAQSTSNEQRIIGSWTLQNPNSTYEDFEETLIFKSDGTLQISSRGIIAFRIEGQQMRWNAPGVGDSQCRYLITETQFILIDDVLSASGYFLKDIVYNYSIVSDGRTLILSFFDSQGKNIGLWLTKNT